MNKRIDVEELKIRASGRWIDIFSILASTELGKAVQNFSGRYTKSAREFCPVHGGKSGEAFYLYRDSNETGGGGCNSCGAHHNGISLLMWAKDWDYVTCLKEVAKAINMEVPKEISFKTKMLKPVELTAKEINEDKRTIAKRDKIISECFPITSRQALPAQRYFARRGLSKLTSLGKEILFHPNLVSWKTEKSNEKNSEDVFIKEGYFPAIVSIVRNVKGEVLNIHRTYITEDGYKAEIQSPRKMGKEIISLPVTGGAVQISPPAKIMAVAEGLETTLAVLEGTGLAVNCVVNTSLMKSWMPTVGTRCVIIFADHDKNNAGVVAAQVLYDKLIKLGYICYIALPQDEDDLENVDWANVLVRYGVDGFPEIPDLSQH